MNYKIISTNLRNKMVLLADYLKENKLTKIEFLIKLGLNKELIKDYTIDDIKILLDEYLPDNELFPTLSNNDIAGVAKKDDLDIIPSENKQVILGAKKIDFYLDDNNTVNDIAYYLMDNNIIVKNHLNYELIRGDNQVDIIINSKETVYDEFGVAKDFSFSCKLLNINKHLDFNNIMRGLQAKSTSYLLKTIKEYLDQNNLTKDDISLVINNNNTRK